MSGWSERTAPIDGVRHSAEQKERAPPDGDALCFQGRCRWRGALNAALLQETFGDLEVGVHQALNRFLGGATLHVEGLLGNET